MVRPEARSARSRGNAYPAQPVVEAITSPIILSDEHIRLDPGGSPPASTAGYDKLVRNDAVAFAADHTTTIRVVYGLSPMPTSGPTTKVTSLPWTHNPLLRSQPAIWIIRSMVNPIGGSPLTWYTAVDPTSAKPFVEWGQLAPVHYAITPDDPAYYLHDVRTQKVGISVDRGPFPAMFQGANKYVYRGRLQQKPRARLLLTVFAGTAFDGNTGRSPPAAIMVEVLPYVSSVRPRPYYSAAAQTGAYPHRAGALHHRASPTRIRRHRAVPPEHHNSAKRANKCRSVGIRRLSPVTSASPARWGPTSKFSLPIRHRLRSALTWKQVAELQVFG